MPFTLAHPAAVIPLCQRLRFQGVMSALVIGSMAPDFVYWLPSPYYRETSHTIPGLFGFCLPAGFLVFWLYHTLIKHPLVSLLPQSIFVRLPQTQSIHWRFGTIVQVLLALLLGAISHTVWDAFTHHGTSVTRLLPFLETPLLTEGDYVLRLYKVLQYGSTVGGLGLLAIGIRRWYERTPPRDNIRVEVLSAWQKAFLITCLTVPSVIGALRSGLYQARWEASLKTLQTFLVSGVITGIGIFSLVLVTLGLLWPWVQRREG